MISFARLTGTNRSLRFQALASANAFSDFYRRLDMRKVFLSLLALLLCGTVIFALSACNDENENKDDHVHMSAHPVRENEIASTCDMMGVYDLVEYCSECGEWMGSITLYSIPHSNSTWIEEIPPTCEDEGTLGHYHCSICEKNFTYDGYRFTEVAIASLSIKANGHKDLINGYNGACTVCGDPITESEGIVYSLSTDGSYAEVIDYTGTATRIKIAETYKGAPVTVIATSAFARKEITSVIIPAGVTYIEDYAFNECNIRNIVIPDSVTTIGFSAFRYCGSLESVIIGNGVEEICSYAFDGCDSLTSLIIGNSVKWIRNNAFSNCNLASVAIPDSVISIGADAFSVLIITGIGEIRKSPIHYENGVGYVDKWVVDADINITNIILREDTVGIADGSFKNPFLMYPSKLRMIKIPNSVKYISSHSFDGCVNLTVVYCEAESQPDSWHSSWNPTDCEIVWGFKETN